MPVQLDTPAKPYKHLVCYGERYRQPKPLRGTDSTKLSDTHLIELKSLQRSYNQYGKKQCMKPLFFKN
jgi:hypothetical protein